MAKRLNDDVLRREGVVLESQIGRQFCRNCGGGIVLDAADHRDADVPHRRVCRKCGGEYGTTLATLHPRATEYSNVRPGFYSSSSDQPSQR
jgi:ribosomal protein S27AE